MGSIAILVRWAVLGGLVYLFIPVGIYFHKIDVCSDYLVPNLFYLVGTMVPVLLTILYARKFPLTTLVAGIAGIFLYVLFVLFPQAIYIQTIIVKICDALVPSHMTWTNFFQAESLSHYFSLPGQKEYLRLYLASLVVTLVSVIWILVRWYYAEPVDEELVKIPDEMER